MAEINEAGYIQIRQHMEATWTFIALFDDVGTEVLRRDLTDPSVTWEHSPVDGTQQVLRLQIVVTGDDADVTPPQTFAESAIVDDGVSTDYFTRESFAAFTIETTEDELTVIHEVEVPQVL